MRNFMINLALVLFGLVFAFGPAIIYAVKHN